MLVFLINIYMLSIQVMKRTIKLLKLPTMTMLGLKCNKAIKQTDYYSCFTDFTTHNSMLVWPHFYNI